MKYFLCKVDSCRRKKILLLTGAVLHITDWVHYYREGYKLKNCEKLGPSPNWGERPNYNPTSPGQNNNMIKHAIKIIYTKLFLCGILKWSQLWVGGKGSWDWVPTFPHFFNLHPSFIDQTK